MATPQPDTYSVAAGVRTVRMGIGTPPVVPSNLAALIGDSITDQGFGVSPWWWQNGLTGGKLKTLANSGQSGTTPNYWITGIDASYLAAYPGLAGLPALGFIGCRIGTNNARGQAIDSTIRAQYDALLVKILSYGQIALLFSIPPIGGTSIAYAGNPAGYNTYLQALADANPTQVKYLDDCAPLRNADGSAKDQYFDAAGIHPNGAGTVLMGIAGAALLAPILASYGYASPLVTDPADKYPAQPQWVPNAVNAGTAGTRDGNWTGQVVTGMGLSSTGSTTGVASIVVADVSDANQVPWQRLTPAQLQAGQRIDLTVPAAGRAITTSDPSTLDQIVQIRFNNFASNALSDIHWWMQGDAGHRVAQDAVLKIGDIGSALTQTVVLRQSLPRPTAVASAGALIYMYFPIAATMSSGIGSIDIRCLSARG